MQPFDPERLLRELAPQVLGSLLRRYRDFPDAEDAVQEALLAASQQWPVDGLPDNPKAWLIQVASRRMTDGIRRDIARRKRELESAMASPASVPALPPDMSSGGDDTLVLIYMCCHSALSGSSAIALTLRAVGGLTTAEIARAFLVPEATMAQRISRAKQTIRESGLTFQLPEDSERAGRLHTVLHVLYLIFNEGYFASHGDQLQRPGLASEAIRLARLVQARLPGDPEVAGLLALMLLTAARRAARAGSLGEAIPLDQQDRSLWDRAAIEEGVACLSRALSQGRPGPFQLQAAIAAVHDEAPSFSATDWPQILALYDLLARISANPIVRLNRLVAVAMVHGPHQALRLLDELQSGAHLKDHHRMDAVRGHLLEMAGDLRAAAACYRAAASRTASSPERNYLLTRAAALVPPPE